MKFCPKCNTILDISHKKQYDKEYEQKGGDVFTKIINDILENQLLTQDDIKSIDAKSLLKSPQFKKLKSSEKEIVYNKIQDLLPIHKKKISEKKYSQDLTKKKAFYNCNKCGYNETIQEGAHIFTRTADNSQNNALDINKNINMMYSDILLRTRKYICPNQKCESHKNPNKREAVMYRKNDREYKMIYICTTCTEKF